MASVVLNLNKSWREVMEWDIEDLIMTYSIIYIDSFNRAQEIAK